MAKLDKPVRLQNGDTIKVCLTTKFLDNENGELIKLDESCKLIKVVNNGKDVTAKRLVI